MRPQGLLEQWMADSADDISSPVTVNLPPYSRPIDVFRWGWIASALSIVVGASFSARMNKRVTVGTDTDRILGAGGTIVLTADLAAGKTGFIVDVPDHALLQVDPGEQMQIEVTDAATTGTGIFFAQFYAQGFQSKPVTLLSQFAPPGATPIIASNPDRLHNLTEVTS